MRNDKIEFTYTRRTRSTSFQMTDQEYNRLRSMSEQQGVAMGYLIRQCLRKHLLKLPVDGL